MAYHYQFMNFYIFVFQPIAVFALFATKLVSSLINGIFLVSFFYIYHEKVLNKNIKVEGLVE